jgi:hypothetical protein
LSETAITPLGDFDGNLKMLPWTFVGNGVAGCGYISHADAERDRKLPIHCTDKGLDKAQQGAGRS